MVLWSHTVHFAGCGTARPKIFRWLLMPARQEADIYE